MAQTIGTISLSLRSIADNSAELEQAIASGAAAVIACGGDGTVSSVHSAVVGTDAAFGIVPSGSGDDIAAFLGFDGNLQAATTRLALYAQDEWNLSPNWAAHAGLRWEGIGTVGEDLAGDTPARRSSVWTPLFHAVYKPDPKGRDQLRLSLTRSYRSPQLGQLIALPSLSSRYPVPGANTPNSPDRAGNPDLAPEDRKSTRLNSSHSQQSRMPSSA